MSGASENAPLGFGPGGDGHREFVRRAWAIVLILAAVVGTVLLLWVASQILLLLFAGILLAIFLHLVSGGVERLTHLNSGWALAVTILLLLGLLAGAGWLLATPVSEQMQQLSDQLPKAIAQLQAQLEKYAFGKNVVEQFKNFSAQLGPLWGQITSFFSMTLESILGMLLIVFFGIYFAADPCLYINGFLSLLPQQRRARAREVIFEIGNHLRHWLLGQLISMTIVGVLTWLGLWLLGVPLSGMLGFIAGLVDFIPVVGPWLAGILAALLGLLKQPVLPLYVALLFVGIHLFESHLLIPQVQKFSTKLPPVLTILALALFTRWFGFLGLLLSTPLLAVVVVLVRTLYQEKLQYVTKPENTSASGGKDQK